jgi:DNA-binding CsgD family transcriptional regulator
MIVRSTLTKETILIVIFAIVVIASGADLVADLTHGVDIEHIVKETVVVSISSIAIAWLLWGLRLQRLEIRSLQQELAAANITQTPPQKYVLEVRQKLGSVVTQQFSEWLLTGSEIEVGWLLLKGLSLKEIAIVRSTQEKTVRQQASSIYKKAGVCGRHAFSAWFIEDIL